MAIKVSSIDEDKRVDIILRLRRYRSKVAEYQACKELYDSLFPSSVQVLSDMPMYRGDTFEPERWAIKRESQADRMRKSLDAMREAYEDTERLTDLLEGDYRTVIVRRYQLNESWEVIAEKLHCHRATAMRWHDRAIGVLIKDATPCDIRMC